MKTILLLRHAKSSHNSSRVKDIDRPLTDRGKKEALRMGMFVKSIEGLPNYVMSSPAKRAKQTAQHFAKTASLDSDLINWNDELYYGGARNYLNVIQKAPSGIDDILILGHNPLLEETVSLLCDDEGVYIIRMVTSALVCIEHPAIEWNQIKPGTARIRWMITPDLINHIMW